MKKVGCKVGCKVAKMLIAELHGYKQYLNSTFGGTLRDIITRHNLIKRQGGFGIVIYDEHKDYVYKIWADDYAWEHWLAYAQEHPSLYFIKALSDVKYIPLKVKTEKQDIQLKYIKLERLYPIDVNIAKTVELLKDLLIHGANINDKEKLNKLIALLKQECKPFLAEEQFNKHEEFFRTVAVTNFELTKRFSSDINARNIMKRKDGTPVITDPIYDKSYHTMILAPVLLRKLDAKLVR